MQELAAFAHFLKARRQAMDLTQRELADRVGCAVSTIAKLEGAERRPSKQLVGLLAEALELLPADSAHLAMLARARLQTVISGGPIVAPAHPSLVGRSPEWQRLQELWQHTSAGAAHLAVLVGAPGIGKTRLASELLRGVRHQGCVAASAQASPVDATLAYRPAIMWLRSHDIRSTLAQLDTVWLSEIARLLPELLDERTDLGAPAPLTEPWQRGRLFEALARAVLADRTPRLLVLDDLHWCDRETLDWLSYLLTYDERAPLLVVVTLRREELTAAHPVPALLLQLARIGLATRIELGPLGAADSALLASEVVGHPLDSALSSQVYAESEGNPLFIVEIAVEVARTQSLGAAAKETQEILADSARSSAPSRPQLPPTVYAVMLARVAHLAAQTRELAELVATADRAVSFAFVRQVTDESGSALAGMLDGLCQQGILREVGEDVYDFTHHKLREVVYAELSGARRHALHERVARALEAIHADDLDHVSAQIAAHFERARLPESALPYYQRAAHAARAIYANAEAMVHLRRGLTLLPEAHRLSLERRQEITWQLWASLGDLLELGGQHEDALAAYHDALAHLSGRNTLIRSQLNRKCAKVWEVQRRYTQAGDAYARAEEVLGAPPDVDETDWWRSWLEVQLDRMWLYFWQGQWPEIVRVAERAQPVVARVGTSLQRARFCHGVVLAAYRRDRFAASAESLAYCQAHLLASQETDDPRQIGFAHYVLGYDLMLQGALDDAERELQTGLRTAEQIGDIVLQTRCLIYLARLSRHRGDIERARFYVGRCLPVAEAGGLHEYVAMVRSVLSWIAWREGNLAAVRSYAEDALRLWRELPIVYSFQWSALLPLIGICVRTHDYAAAVAHARALLDPLQQGLPQAVSDELQAAIEAWDPQRDDATHAHLSRALVAAEQAGYL